MSELTYSDFQLINMDLINTKDQVRKKFDEVAINELATSINKIGILNPITITPDGDSKYKIVAGERRFRAAKLNKWTEIPAIIVEGDENQLREIQLIENCQRKDMNPIEELEAYSGLLMAGYKPENISTQIGKSLTYIHSRLRLARLTDRAKELVYKEEINLTHCKYLCVMSPELQEQALDKLLYTTGNDEVQYLPAKNFEEFFNKNQTIELAKSQFDIKVENLIKDVPACGSCPHNSEYNKTLFEGVSSKALCTKPECHKQKTEVHIKNCIESWTNEGIEVIEAAEHYSEVYKNTFEYTQVPESIIASEKEFKVETILIIVEGSKEKIGQHYPVYSESQLKAMQKATKATKSTTTQNQQEQKKAEKAIKRFTELVISRISESYVQKNELFTPGIHLLAIYKLYTWLGVPEKEGFIKALFGNVEVEASNHHELSKVFFSHLNVVEENIEKAFAIISLLHLDSSYAYKDEPQFALVSKLATEADVNIEDCRAEISKESGVDLSEV